MKRTSTIHALLVGFLASFTAITVPGVTGQGAEPPSAPADVPATQGRPSGVPREGIQVHGDWVVEVLDPDGTLVSRHEISNALTDTGKVVLVDFLLKERTPGLWEVRFIGAAGLCPAGACIVLEPADAQAASTSIFKNLQALGADFDAFSEARGLDLTGSFTPSASTTISSAETSRGRCAPSTAPDSCTGGFPGANLTTTSGLAIPVTSGQTVNFVIQIRFS